MKLHVETLCSNQTLDWQKCDSASAKMRILVNIRNLYQLLIQQKVNQINI